MAIRIITDSAADYEQHELQKLNVNSVPLSVTFGETSYIDGPELTKDMFYDMLLNGKKFPTTSQPSPDAFLTQFKEAKKQGDAVIAILLSSGLSGTYQSANIAKHMAEYDDIHIIDSATAATCLRLLVDTAVKLRAEGLSAADIAASIEDLKSRVQLYAMIDTLEYLHRGGRLTKTAAAVGEIAKLKPIITLKTDGTIAVVEKCLGKRRAYKKLLSLLNDHMIDTDYPVYFVYSCNKDNCIKFVDLMSRFYDFTDASHMYNIGPTIGTHVGSGAFGLSFVNKK